MYYIRSFKEFLGSNLFKSSGVYLITSVLSSAIPFFLTPILTRFLTPEEYGVVSMFYLLVSVFNIFTGLSIHGSISKAYFESDIDFREYLFNCSLIIFFGTLLTLVVVVFFLRPLAKISSVPTRWIVLAVITSALDYLTVFALTIYQVKMLATRYSMIQLSKSIFGAFLSIVLVVIVGLGWEGRVLGQLLASVITGLISLLVLKKWMTCKINFKYLYYALSYGVPLIPHCIGGMLLVFTDRFIITNSLGIEKTGIYMAALQIGGIVGILTESFNKAYAPWLFSILSKNNQDDKVNLVRFTYFFFVLLITLAVTLGQAAPYITDIYLGEGFKDSSSLVLWILLGSAFNGMYYMVVNYIFYTHNTYILSLITLVNGTINILLTQLLVTNFGLIGAGYSYAITLLSQFLLTWILSARMYKMPWLSMVWISKNC